MLFRNLLKKPDRPRVFSADAVSRADPTGTGKIRRRFESDVVRRVRKVRALARHALVEQDVLGLKAPSVSSSIFIKVFRGEENVTVPGPKAFSQSEAIDKIHAFMEWFYDTQHQVILGTRRGSGRAGAAREAWFNKYLDAARKKGGSDARRFLPQARVDAMDAKKPKIAGGFGPTSKERIDLLRSKTYTDLEGITDAMSLRIQRTLTRGLTEGKSIAEIARDLSDGIEKIGVTRARTLARTEVIEAHAEGALDEYAEAGVEGVTVMAEFATAGDDSVCPECEGLEGNIYTIEEARGLIPVHPNCRCAWIPIMQEDEWRAYDDGELYCSESRQGMAVERARRQLAARVSPVGARGLLVSRKRTRLLHLRRSPSKKLDGRRKAG